jgi:hypothetical protein
LHGRKKKEERRKKERKKEKKKTNSDEESQQGVLGPQESMSLHGLLGGLPTHHRRQVMRPTDWVPIFRPLRDGVA